MGNSFCIEYDRFLLGFKLRQYIKKLETQLNDLSELTRKIAPFGLGFAITIEDAKKAEENEEFVNFKKSPKGKIIINLMEHSNKSIFMLNLLLIVDLNNSDNSLYEIEAKFKDIKMQNNTFEIELKSITFEDEPDVYAVEVEQESAQQPDMVK